MEPAPPSIDLALTVTASVSRDPCSKAMCKRHFDLLAICRIFVKNAVPWDLPQNWSSQTLVPGSGTTRYQYLQCCEPASRARGDFEPIRSDSILDGLYRKPELPPCLETAC